MSEIGRRLAAQQLHERQPDVRLIFVHPNFAQQHAVLSDLPDDAVYIRFRGTQLSREDAKAQIQEAVGVQASDLRELSMLVIDEADRALMGEFIQLLRELLQEMLHGVIVILSRELPAGVLVDSDLRQQSKFVPARESMMLWDYARQQDGTGSLLEVRALGAGRVQLNGHPVSNWDGSLPRSLFFYLVDRGMVRRAEIFDTFWPDLTTREATNVFHVTKRKISEVLGTDLTVYWSGFYHISPRIQMSYDVALFTEMAQDSAIASLEESAALLEEAIALYRGDFLTSIESKWVVRRRQDLQQAFGDALISLAKIYERTNQPQRALSLYLRATATNVHREDLALNTMRLYRDLQLHQEALVIYERLQKELRETLNVTPGRELRDLADAIRNEAQ
jgi:DNA-binding SARP family transcriptional activator